MTLVPVYPTPLHRQAADVIAGFCAAQPLVDTLLIVNSCARGQALPESDLDAAVLVQPNLSAGQVHMLETAWASFAADHPLLEQFRRSSRFAHIHLDIIQGQYSPTQWDDGGGPDTFEIEIGNQVAHAAPYGAPGAFFRSLQARWLPFYDEVLRSQRLAMAAAACAYDLEFIPFYTRRGLYFQAFHRLYKASQEFLQALFIARRTYPVAYNKWIREQVAGWLGLPALYAQLPALLSISNLESDEILTKAALLHTLMDQWLPS